MKKLMVMICASCFSLAAGGAYAMSHAQDEMKKDAKKGETQKGQETSKDAKDMVKDMSKGEMKKGDKKGEMKKDDKY